MNIKHRIVFGLDAACDRTHFITYRRPWAWLPFRHAAHPLGWLAAVLNDRWHTGLYPIERDVP